LKFGGSSETLALLSSAAFSFSFASSITAAALAFLNSQSAAPVELTFILSKSS